MDPTVEIGFDAGKERKLSGEAKLRKCPGDLVELRVCQFFGQKKKNADGNRWCRPKLPVEKRKNGKTRSLSMPGGRIAKVKRVLLGAHSMFAAHSIFAGPPSTQDERAMSFTLCYKIK